jgi:hypothetical protein
MVRDMIQEARMAPENLQDKALDTSSYIACL